MHVIVSKNSEFLQTMLDCVEKYMNYNGRRWVDMASLFNFMGLR
jgi:hypothetical protein